MTNAIAITDLVKPAKSTVPTPSASPYDRSNNKSTFSSHIKRTPARPETNENKPYDNISNEDIPHGPKKYQTKRDSQVHDATKDKTSKFNNINENNEQDHIDHNTQSTDFDKTADIGVIDTSIVNKNELRNDTTNILAFIARLQINGPLLSSSQSSTGNEHLITNTTTDLLGQKSTPAAINTPALPLTQVSAASSNIDEALLAASQQEENAQPGPQTHLKLDNIRAFAKQNTNFIENHIEEGQSLASIIEAAKNTQTQSNKVVINQQVVLSSPSLENTEAVNAATPLIISKEAQNNTNLSQTITNTSNNKTDSLANTLFTNTDTATQSTTSAIKTTPPPLQESTRFSQVFLDHMQTTGKQDDIMQMATPGFLNDEQQLQSSHLRPLSQRPTIIPLPTLAAHIVRQSKAGNTQFDIRLDPPELGRINVRLDIDADGQTRAHLTVERSETLDLLQRDSRFLERALGQNGLKTEQGSVSFQLDEHTMANGGQSNHDPSEWKQEKNGDDRLINNDESTTTVENHQSIDPDHQLNMVI